MNIALLKMWDAAVATGELTTTNRLLLQDSLKDTDVRDRVLAAAVSSKDIKAQEVTTREHITALLDAECGRGVCSKDSLLALRAVLMQMDTSVVEVAYTIAYLDWNLGADSTEIVDSLDRVGPPGDYRLGHLLLLLLSMRVPPQWRTDKVVA